MSQIRNSITFRLWLKFIFMTFVVWNVSIAEVQAGKVRVRTALPPQEVPRDGRSAEIGARPTATGSQRARAQSPPRYVRLTEADQPATCAARQEPVIHRVAANGGQDAGVVHLGAQDEVGRPSNWPQGRELGSVFSSAEYGVASLAYAWRFVLRLVFFKQWNHWAN